MKCNIFCSSNAETQTQCIDMYCTDGAEHRQLRPRRALRHLLPPFLVIFTWNSIFIFNPILISLQPLFSLPLLPLLPLLQGPILPLGLLNLTSLLLPRGLCLKRNPTLIPLLPRLNPIR